MSHSPITVYVLQFPQGGSALVLVAIVAVTFHGQGMALDPSDPEMLYGIDRAKREVVVTRIRRA